MTEEDISIRKINEFIQKVDQMKRQDKMDLSSDQDLSIAIMNLISIEEHFFFTAEKTEKKEYYDFLKDVREMRKSLLKKIVKDYEGEIWCISKHLLAASMRLMEVGTKQLSMGKEKEAYSFFEKSYHLYSLFWAINMKLINIGDVKKIGDDFLSKTEQEKLENSEQKEKYEEVSQAEKKELSKEKVKKQTGLAGKLKTLIKKAIDCCIE